MGGIPGRIHKTHRRGLLRSLIAITIEGWGICALFCMVMAFGARTQAIAPFINGLSICDGKPCYLNISPRKTGWEEAQNILASFPEIKRSVTETGFYDLPGFYGRLLLIPNQDSIIQEIDLSPTDNLTYIGSAILQLGVPCAIVPSGDTHLGFIYPGISIITRVRKMGHYFVLRPTSPIVQANLFSRFKSCNDVDLGISVPNSQWLGFSRYYDGTG